MVLDTFTERLVWIISELEGKDIREDFRREQIRNLVLSSFQEIADPVIIQTITEELYQAIYGES
jgi:hypothetical protein